MAINPTGGPSNGQRSFLQSNIAAAAELPPPEISFRMGHIVQGMPGRLPPGHSGTLSESEFKKLLANGIIEAAEDRNTHRTNAKYWDAIVELRQNRETHTCGHTGLFTVDADEGVYQCTREFCDQLLSREDVNMEAIN